VISRETTISKIQCLIGEPYRLIFIKIVYLSAGIVEGVGSDVELFKVGDEVFFAVCIFCFPLFVSLTISFSSLSLSLSISHSLFLSLSLSLLFLIFHSFQGENAEYAIVDERNVRCKPKSFTWEQACLRHITIAVSSTFNRPHCMRVCCVVL
jgi:NADPH:quinone reductase-like Zn-dependent oxidoreductase